MSLFEKYAKLRDIYPDDIGRIEAEENQVKGLMERQDLAAHPALKELVALCRREVVMMRRTLATDRSLDTDARNALWNAIDSRQWILALLAQDFEGQLTQIEHDLEAELAQ